MIAACVFCGRQGLPVVQGELPPYADATVLWTLCRLHREEARARLRALALELRAVAVEAQPGPEERA